MLEYPDKVRRILTALGFNIRKPPYGVNMRGILFISLSIYLCLEAVNSMIKYWDNMSLRFLSIEHIIITLIVTCVLFDYAIKPENIQKLLRISEEDCFSYKEMFVEEREKIINESCSEINFGARLVYRLLILEFLALAFSPLIHVCFVVITSYYGTNGNKSDVFDIRSWSLPLSDGYDHKTIYSYAVLYGLNIVYLYGGIMFAYCFTNSCTFAIHKTTTELILFNVALKCYDKLYCKFDVNKEGKLKNALREIVMHHNLIYRKCRILTESLGMTLTIVNNGLTFLSCVHIYSFVKATNTAFKFKYISEIVPGVAIIYLYSLKGQKLINVNETIYQSIAELSWLDKPEWFKKCLLLMLTRNKQRTEVKPFGLYVVDLRNFAVVINGAYSYFNLLLRLS